MMMEVVVVTRRQAVCGHRTYGMPRWRDPMSRVGSGLTGENRIQKFNARSLFSRFWPQINFLFSSFETVF
jgi:hypothetical protein